MTLDTPTTIFKRLDNSICVGWLIQNATPQMDECSTTLCNIIYHIYIIVEKSPNSSHMYDHGFMDNTNRQAVKNWLDSQTRDASLTSWRQPFCKFTKWLPPWRKGRISCLWIKSVFDCLTIGIIHETMVVHMTWVWTFFNNYSNHPRMCVLSTLCGNVDKHSPFDIYIYI